VVVAVLVGLFLATGVFTGIVREGGGSEAEQIPLGHDNARSDKPADRANPVTVGAARSLG
jgi:hypothetical protein